MEDTLEIDLLALLKKNAVLLIVCTIVLGAVAFGVSYLMPNEYTASTSVYVLRQDKKGEAVQADQTELTLASSVANDVVSIMKSEKVASDVAEELGLTSLAGFQINIANETNSRLINLKVTGKNPQTTADVANEMVETTRDVAVEAMNLKAINVINEATAPQNPSGPNHMYIGVIGAAAGFAIAFAIAFVSTSLDTRVHADEDVVKLTGIPVVGHFPVLN